MTPAKLTGPRAELATAIQRVTALASELDELQLAAFRLPPGAVDAQEAAEEALKAARQRERQPATILGRARGQRVDGLTLAEAETALAAANADIAKAQANCRAVASAVPRAESDLQVATARRDELIAEVVRTTPEVVALLAEHRALEVRLANVVAMLAKLPGLPANTFYVRQPEPDKVAVAAVTAWRSALATDATAAWPDFDPPSAPEQAKAA